MALIVSEKEQKKTAQVTSENKTRNSLRLEVTKRVEYSVEGNVVSRSYTKNLSLAGASIFAFSDLPAGQHIKLRFHLSDEVNFEAQGHVVWRKLAPTHKLFGIVFEDLSRKAQESIIRQAFDLRLDHLLN